MRSHTHGGPFEGGGDKHAALALGPVSTIWAYKRSWLVAF
jgi:hypothetical protein